MSTIVVHGGIDENEVRLTCYLPFREIDAAGGLHAALPEEYQQGWEIAQLWESPFRPGFDLLLRRRA